jgi:hypothetical protein
MSPPPAARRREGPSMDKRSTSKTRGCGAKHMVRAQARRVAAAQARGVAVTSSGRRLGGTSGVAVLACRAAVAELDGSDGGDPVTNRSGSQ